MLAPCGMFMEGKMTVIGDTQKQHVFNDSKNSCVTRRLRLSHASYFEIQTITQYVKRESTTLVRKMRVFVFHNIEIIPHFAQLVQ